jgi:peptidoglycan/LPS O-acetylase OafA/YrhL
VVSEFNPTWRGLSFQWLPANIDLFAIGMAVAVLTMRVADSRPTHGTIGRLVSNAEVMWAMAAALIIWYILRVGPPDQAQLGDPYGAYRGAYWQQRQWVLGVLSLLLLAPLVLGSQGRGPVRRFLGLQRIVWLGTISYGLYLWHLPIMEWAARRSQWGTSSFLDAILPTVGTRGFLYFLLVGLTIGCAFAAASWRWVERPAQRVAAHG